MIPQELPSSAIGVVKQFATTQTQVDVMSDQIIQSVKEGEASALDIQVALKAFEKVSKRVLSEIENEILNEAERYPEKTFDYLGNKLTKTEVGVKYDYSICADPIHDRLDAAFNKAKADLDERRKFLQSLKSPLKTIDEETGEMIEIKPPLKTSTSTVTVSIK